MKLYKRENYLSRIRGFYHANDLIKVLTGVRRCGKSSIMTLIAEELLEEGIPNENIIYLNLDKRGYRSVKTADQFDAILEPTLKIPGTKYLFIDEIQNVDSFEKVINAYREEEEYSIFISGSNSYLLSGELITKLTGRYIEFEIFPLSFDEYLHMKEFYKIPLKSNLLAELEQYAFEGGFPRTVLLNSLEDKRRYAEEVVNEIFSKDIYRRIKVKNREVLDLVKNYIINNYGNTTSIKNIAEGISNAGYKIMASTVSRYVRALIDAKILYQCDRFDMKSKRMLKGEKKYYLADLSFSFLTNPDSRINFGPALENIVYMYARSKDCFVNIGKIGKLECDFIIKNRRLDYAYVQVSYTIHQSRDTEEREYRPLEAIHDGYPRYLATTDTLLQKRGSIKHINIMDFMKDERSFTD